MWLLARCGGPRDVVSGAGQRPRFGLDGRRVMEASPNNHEAAVIDLRTGEVIETKCPDCANHQRMITSLMRQRTELERKLDDKRKAEAEAADIVEVLSYWRDRCSKRPDSTRVDRTSHPRWEKVRARLNEDFTVGELKLVVDGALASPFHNGTDPKNDVARGGKQFLAAETLFKNAKTCQDHIHRAERYVDLVGALPSEVNHALIGLNMQVELEICDCGHERLFHVGLADVEGREVCKRCDCGDFTRFGT